MRKRTKDQYRVEMKGHLGHESIDWVGEDKWAFSITDYDKRKSKASGGRGDYERSDDQIEF